MLLSSTRSALRAYTRVGAGPHLFGQPLLSAEVQHPYFEMRHLRLLTILVGIVLLPPAVSGSPQTQLGDGFGEQQVLDEAASVARSARSLTRRFAQARLGDAEAAGWSVRQKVKDWWNTRIPNDHIWINFGCPMAARFARGMTGPTTFAGPSDFSSVSDWAPVVSHLIAHCW